MRITIGIIKINVITNVGSLNVGKTILCNNRSLVTVRPGPAETGETPAAQDASDESAGRRHDPKARSDHSP